HLKWFNHYLSCLLDRIHSQADAAQVGEAHFQLFRVVAGAGGSVAFTVLLNAFRNYLQSRGGLCLVPIDAWRRLLEALERKDTMAARDVFQRCFDLRTAEVLGRLSALRAHASEPRSTAADGVVAPSNDDIEPQA